MRKTIDNRDNHRQQDAAGALAFHAAFAGLFSTGLGDPDVGKIRRLGVVSALGDTLMGRSVGITVFNNKSFKATIPNRDLDAVFRGGAEF